MKRKLLFAVMMFAFSWANAQFQDIIDPAFEDELILRGYDSNPTRDGVISIADAQAITFLNMSGHPVPSADTNLIGVGITDLTGIKAFSNLDTLWVHGNDLTELDLGGMSTLKDVRAFINDLETININGLTNLEIIGLDVNNLTEINVSTNTNLEVFDIAQNNLSNLDITGLNALTNMNVQNNPLLTCIQVQDVATATSLNNNAAFRKNGPTQFNADCNIVYDVQVSVPEAQEIDANGFHVVRAANAPIVLQFNAVDANGQDLNASLLSDYDLTITTLPDPNRNPAAGGDISVAGIDFELLNNVNQNVAVQNGQIDFSRPIPMQGDSAFEADEYFIVQVTSNDPNVNLSNSTNGIVTFPVRIIDNEITNVNLQLVNNGIEGSQDARLRITSSLQNDTGAPMPFNIALGGGLSTAILGEDYQDLANQPSIANGESSVEFDVIILNNDIEAEIEEEFYAIISYTGDLPSDRVVVLNGPEGVEVPIVDDGDVDETPFTVSTTIGGDVFEVSGTACCPEYQIEEGQLLEIYFDAETSAPDGEEYIVQVSFANGTAAEQDVSVRENSPNFQYTYSVKSTSPDNILQIDIVDDMIEEANGENLRITITPIGSNFTLSGATVYDILIKDSTSIPEPFLVSADISGAGNSPNYTIEEGQSFRLNFDTGSTGSLGANYKPLISVTRNGIETTEDFTIADLDQSFTIRSNNPDGHITFTANDDMETEGDEVYTISITSEDSNAYIINNPTSFEITVTDKVEINNDTFDVSLTLGGDVINVGSASNPNYQINEGGSLVIEVESLGDPVIQNYSFIYSDNLNEIPDDFSRNFFVDNELPLISFTPNADQNPDNTYQILVLNDGIVDDSNEQIRLSFQPRDNFTINNTNDIEFTISIIDVDDTDSTEVFAALDNTGGTEGGTDTFTIELTEGGEPWLNNTGQNITFPVVFTNERSDGFDFDLAEDGDYTPLNGDIIIAPNSSTGSLTVQLIDDNDNDHEYYLATLGSPTSSVTIINTKNSLQAKIIDKNSPFTIEAKIMGITTLVSSDCCPEFGIEEGELIEITLEAEKGVVDETPFDLQINYSGSAIKDEDFSNRDTRDATTTDNIFGYSVKTNVNPDNTIEILILTDNDLDEFDSFGFSITSTDTQKYQLSGETTRSMSIIDPIPAQIETVLRDANESPITNGEFSISLDTPATTNTTIFYELDASSTADISDFHPLTGFVEIPIGEVSAPLIITPINDEIVEDLESVIIRLIDGTGYGIQGSGVASINIESEDLAPTVAIIEATDTEASEIDTLNRGEFTFSIDNTNPQEDTKIDFEILSNETSDANISDYILLDKNEEPLGDKRFVIIEAGSQNTKVFVQAVDDTIEEDDEDVRIRLISGVGYAVGSPNQGTVTIESRTFNEEEFDPKSIRVTAQSAICASKDEGGILVENASGFVFSVVIKKDDDEDFSREGTLEGAPLTFSELTTGTYTVTLENVTNPNLIAPSFTVQIQKQEAISGEVEGVNLTTKIANIKVSGSNIYTVSAGLKKFTFNYETIEPQMLSIPLEVGLNDISIEGAANCQGKVELQLFIEELYVYPNPTEGIVNVLGLEFGEEFDILISDITGRVILKETKTLQSNPLLIDLLIFQTGLYFGKITSGNRTVDFKILKQNK